MLSKGKSTRGNTSIIILLVVLQILIVGIRAFSAIFYTLVICRLYLAIIANATTFRVTATMESSVLEQIMGCANAENVFAIQNGTVQVNFRER